MNAMVMDNRTYNGYDYFSRSEMRIRANKKRRMEIVRRQRVFLGAMVAMLLALIVSLGTTVIIKAQNNDTAPEVKYYTVQMVHSGDTLESLAKERFSKEHYVSFEAYLNEIMRINHLDAPEDLMAGENVVIPYYDVYR
jgi:LysM repeat protein